MPGCKKSHCQRGHKLSGDNLYEYRGCRYCRACRAATNKKWLEGGCEPRESHVSVTADMLEYSRIYEKSNKSHRAALKKNRRKRIRKWYRDYKRTLVCSRCPENHLACLTFHHLEPSNKHSDVTAMVQGGSKIEKILAEIEKCIVLCAKLSRQRALGRKLRKDIMANGKVDAKRLWGLSLTRKGSTV